MWQKPMIYQVSFKNWQVKAKIIKNKRGKQLNQQFDTVNILLVSYCCCKKKKNYNKHSGLNSTSVLSYSSVNQKFGRVLIELKSKCHEAAFLSWDSKESFDISSFLDAAHGLQFTAPFHHLQSQPHHATSL